jgi:peptidyl-dipeptidase Dcp
MRTVLFIAAAGICMVLACTNQTTKDSSTDNVLLADWQGPYSGVPAFDKMDLDMLVPALETAMAINLKEIDDIANQPDAPSFENTIVAMEATGVDYDRVATYYRIWSANRSTPEFRDIQREMVPKLSEFRTKITQN